ncbi:MAG: STAS/SEC14 domain-containing protein [Balneolaceae bacterium]
MINFIDVESRNVVGIRMNGKITDQEFDAVAALLEKRMQEFPKVNVYVEVESFGGMAPKTFIKDLRFGFDNLDRFDKEAVVTEKDWIQKITPIADKIFDSIEVKTFSFDQKDEAKKWVRQSNVNQET